jgi:hypothetical protein
MERCIDRCTFDWYVDSTFVTRTTDKPSDHPLAGVHLTGSVQFTATSRITQSFSVGTHRLVVVIKSGDGATARRGATIRIAGVRATLPPTSTVDARVGGSPSGSGMGGALILFGTALVVAAWTLSERRRRDQLRHRR